MKRCTDKDFEYTPAKKMGPDYLKRKFDRIRKQQRANKAEVAAKVEQLPKRSANGSR